jgi:hypothetical protein
VSKDDTQQAKDMALAVVLQAAITGAEQLAKTTKAMGLSKEAAAYAIGGLVEAAIILIDTHLDDEAMEDEDIAITVKEWRGMKEMMR